MKITKIAILAILVAAPALADEVLMKNGDRFTGTIVQADDEKLTINTAVAGNIVVELKDVKTFSSDEPVALKLKDGSTVDEKVADGEDGTVNAVGAAGAVIEAVPLTNIAAINPPPVKWAGDLTAGGLLTRGNSQSEQLNVGFDASRRGENDLIDVGAGYLFGEQKDNATDTTTTSTDNWFVRGKYEYFFTKKFYGYGDIRAEKDRIAALDFRATPTAGIGYQWVEKPTLSFSTEIGAGWVYEDFHHAGNNEYASGRGAYHLKASINDKVTFTNDLVYLQSLQKTGQFIATVDTGLRCTLTAKMFAELKNEWQYDAAPAPGAYKNDIRWILNVGWQF